MFAAATGEVVVRGGGCGRHSLQVGRGRMEMEGGVMGWSVCSLHVRWVGDAVMGGREAGSGMTHETEVRVWSRHPVVSLG